MRSLMLVCVLALVSLSCPSETLARKIEVSRKPSERPRLKSIYSVEQELSDLKTRDTKAMVFVYLDVDCPVAQQYAGTLVELSNQFEKQGVAFYGVYPNARTNVVSMAAHAHDQDFPFPVFLDRDQKLAKLMEVSVTPEVVVLDPNWNIAYQGAIDNQFKKGGKIADATEFYLKDALDNLLAGRPIAEPYLRASGCPLEERQAPVSVEKLTYYRDVAPIVQTKCQGCHRPGGVGPFELMNYDDAYYSADRILEVVQERRMPPWHGFLNPEFGKLKNAQNLSDDEISKLTQWIEQGAPAGDPKDAPAPRKYPQKDDWEIGKPDYVYRIKPFTVPKSGILDYQFFRVPMRFTEDRWFNAVQVKPGNDRVVHHVGLHIVPAGDQEFSGFGGMAALYGFTTEGAVLINDYVPGDTYNATIYPKGQAVKIPKNSDLIFEIHYTTTGKSPEVDQSMVGFRWAQEPPTEEVFTKVFRRPVGRFNIPPHVSHYRMEDSYHFKKDVLIDAVRPHFHYRGKSYRVEVIERDPATDEITSRRTLLTVPVFDEGWQRTYELETPLLLKAGTEILATGHFDNSRLNPRNPNPNATVHWGQQTNDEMFSTRFKYRLTQSSDKE
jgi:peroxiredoxin/mono/diheme cytochrome c family protein